MIHVTTDALTDDAEKLPCTGSFWLLPEHIHEFLQRAAKPGVGLCAAHVFEETHVERTAPLPTSYPFNIQLPLTRHGYRVFLQPMPRGSKYIDNLFDGRS